MYLSHVYLFIPLSVDMRGFHLFVIADNAAMNMGVQVSYLLKSLPIFVPLKAIRCLHFGI